MTNIITSLKQQLHREIVNDPILHARVLNLYLSGEAYPHTVDDYFPVEHVECPELAATMRSHMQDEDKHITLYAKAIEALGAEVIDLPETCIFNHVVRAHTTDPWAIHRADTTDVKRDRIANFFAHAHCLEKRIARSLEFHLDACSHAHSSRPSKAVSIVLHDEHRHVGYTYEAIFDLVPRQRAQDILASHRRAEYRANLDFSASQLRRLLREERSRWRPVKRLMYAGCSRGLHLLLACT